jgi:prolyl-tRNA synthetase
MPPRLAPIQVVIVPIFKNDAERATVMEAADRMFKALKAGGVRVKLDDREGLSPGFKYSDWEMRGVPIRMEIGPKDVEKGSVALARRDIPGRDGKQFVSQDTALAVVKSLLEDIHNNMLAQATKFRDENIVVVEEDYAKFQEVVKDRWAYSPFCGEPACEAKIKEENQVVSRCFPLNQEPHAGHCIGCGKPVDQRAYFAKAY